MLPNPLDTRFGRLSAFFLLYMTEGIPLGFVATALATVMRREGVPADEIGLFIGTLYLPWSWKWVIAPFVDLVGSKRFGRRRPWIIVAQLGMCTMLLATLAVDFTAQLKLFTVLIFIANLFGATQDVAIDALACDILEEHERGTANGVMFAGAYAGQAVGGAGVLYLMNIMPVPATFFVVSGCVLMVTVFIAFPLREPRQDGTGDDRGDPFDELKRYLGDAVRSLFGSRASIAGFLFALLPCGTYSLSLVLQTVLAVEFRMSDSEIATLALVTTITSAVSCLAGGWASDAFGRRRAIALFAVLTVVPTLFMAMRLQEHQWIFERAAEETARAPEALIRSFWIACIVFAVPHGMMYGSRTALFMDLVRDPRVAATHFTASMALLNVTIAYSSVWIGQAISRWGYPKTLMIDAGLGLVCLLVLPFTLTGHRATGVAPPPDPETLA